MVQAKAEIQRRMPDAILTDMMLPDGTGFEIFGGAPPKNVEMILMISFSSIDTSIEALRLGFHL